MSQLKIILVAGPTAAGKSALALDLARKNNGAIINADAMQIYAGLPILTAQPSPEEQKEIPHELYGVLDPAERSSAGRWLVLAMAAIEKTVAAGRTPILTGGTGLYFRALLVGLSNIPPVPDNVRAEAQKLYDELGEEHFRRELAKLDPDSAAKLAKNDRQRLVRAYEVARHTGKPLSEWQKKTQKIDPSPAKTKDLPSALAEASARQEGQVQVFASSPARGEEPPLHFPASNLQPLTPETHLIMPERTELYAACDARFVKMIEHGAVEEVKKFLERKLDDGVPAMKTIGVREIGKYLRGEWELDEAIAKAQQLTRNYAKRQMTWFRNQKLN